MLQFYVRTTIICHYFHLKIIADTNTRCPIEGQTLKSDFGHQNKEKGSYIFP